MTPSPSPQPAVRTVSIGGATVDLFVRTGTGIACVKNDAITFPLGAKIRIEQVIETCGGGATNTAIGLRRLGCEAGFSGIVGSDQWGERILQNLDREGVDSSAATIVENETSGFSIIMNVECGERVILYANGVNAHLHDVTFDRETVAGNDWLYFNHIHDDSRVIQDDIVLMLRGNPKMGMTWNPGGRHLKRGMDHEDNVALLKQTDLLLLNKEEALTFTHKQSPERAIEALLKAGVSIVCVSDGPNGCMASDGRTLYSCPAIQEAEILDTTGAGDAFGTGATWARIRGLDLPIMLRAGTINATSVLGTIGAQTGLLTDIDMQKRLESTRLDVDERPL